MIFDSQEYGAALKAAAASAASHCLIASAFLKLDALEELVTDMGTNPIDVQVVARWRKGDLSCGASDLGVYEWCAQRGWKFGVNLNFHGKLYMFEATKIFLGSANLTNSGLSFFSPGNKEFGTIVDAEDADLGKIDRFLRDEVLWLDDGTFSLMRDELLRIDSPGVSIERWSEQVQTLLKREVQYLWVSELLFCPPSQLLSGSPSDEALAHDCALLSIDLATVTPDFMKVAFRRSRVYVWLCSVLTQQGSLNFGGISARLHNALLDDPRPYRRQVKQFVATLFAWFEFMPEDFVITRYTRTASVSLKIHS